MRRAVLMVFLFLACGGVSQAADFTAATNHLATSVLGAPFETGALAGVRAPVASAEWDVFAPTKDGAHVIPYETAWVFQIDSEPFGERFVRPRTVVILSEDLSALTAYTSSVPVFLRRKAGGRKMTLETLNDDTIPRTVAPRTAAVRGAQAKTVTPLANTENNTNLFAVLISGGADPRNNGIRFFYDIRNAYQTLKEKCAVPRENIFTFVASGVETNKEHLSQSGYSSQYVAVDYDLDGDGTKDVTGGANRDAITNCLQTLSARLTTRDRLLVVFSTHGSRYSYADFASWKTIAWLWNDYVWDEEFRGWMKDFACPVAFALQQCFSGGFADDLVKTSNRVVGTAANHLESSWGYATYNLYLHSFFNAVASGLAMNFYDAALAAYNDENLLAHPQYAESTPHLGCEFRFDSASSAETYETVAFELDDAEAVCLMTNVDYRTGRTCDWMPDAFSSNGFLVGWTALDATVREAVWAPYAVTNDTPIEGLSGVIAAEIAANGSRRVAWTAQKDALMTFSLDGSSGTGSLVVRQGSTTVASESASGASWPSVSFEATEDVVYTITITPSSGSLILARLGWHVEERFVDGTNGSDANDGLSPERAFKTIQAAIDAVVDGATIHVAAGRYAPIDSAGKEVTIVSDDGATETFIDGDGASRCAELRGWTHSWQSGYVRDDESHDTVLDGFTLENGSVSASYACGAGSCGGTLKRCIIRHCTANGSSEVDGAATYCGELDDCLVYGNTASSSGNVYGGACYESDLYNCTVADNVVTASRQVVGGGLYTYGYRSGGGFYTYGIAINSIIVGTTVAAATVYGENAYNAEGGLGYSKTRTGGDPKFVDRANGDYRLAADSPCIDVGYSDYAPGDVDLAGTARVQGGDVDQGCYESPYTAPTPVVPDVTPTRGGRHYGVFVGINEFSVVTPSLTGCIPDAESMRTHCLKSGLWHAEDISFFTNGCATEVSVRAAIQTYAATAQAGDTFIYMQSSHGGNCVDDKMSAYLCMYDCAAGVGGADGYYDDTELAEDLLQFPEGVRVLVYVDACRSGGLFQTWETNLLSLNEEDDDGEWNFAARVRAAMNARTTFRRAVQAPALARVTSGTHVTSSVGTNIAFITAADYDQYSWDGGAAGGLFTAAFVEGWTNGYANVNGDGKIDFYELYDYAASIATGDWSWVSYRTEAQCDNAALLKATLAGYEAGTWPEPEISPTDTPAEQAAKVQDAMIGAGFPASTAAVITNAADYASIKSWAEDHNILLGDMAASSVAILSPALGAEELLTNLTSNDLQLTELKPSETGTTWTMSLSIADYEAARANESLLRAAVDIVGSRSLASAFTSDELSVSVRKGAETVELTVTPPPAATNYFLRATVR